MSKRTPKRHIIIPDTQVKPGNDLKFLKRIGKYISEHEPDTVIMLGDFADMESLSSYDKGRKDFEGRRYTKDINAAKSGMDILMDSMLSGTANPELILTLGNHENRIERATQIQPELDGLLSSDDLQYGSYGWRVIPFLVPITIDGVVYCHYFVSGVMGRPVSSAARLVSTKHQSCIAGHQQGRQVAYGVRADGRMITSMIVGSCYEHNESYMGPQGNKHWRGIIVLNEVSDGQFDEMFVSLDYLKRVYK